MKRKLMCFMVAITMLVSVCGVVAFAAASEPELLTSGFKTELSVKGGGASVTTAQDYAGAYSYEVDFLAKGVAGQGLGVFDINLGVGGSHYIKIVVNERPITAWIFPTEGGGDSGANIPVTGQADLVNGNPDWWVLNGLNSFKFKFVMPADWKKIDIYYAISGSEYPLTPNNSVDLTNADESKDYQRLKPTDGKIQFNPDFHEQFKINSIKANEMALDLGSDDILLNKSNLFAKNYSVSNFTVDSSTESPVKYVSPFAISTQGFAENEEVFLVSYDVKRGKVDNAAVWNTNADFGLLFGMSSIADTLVSDGVGSILNSATYGDKTNVAAGYTVMTIGKGKGTATEIVGEVGSVNAEGAPSKLFQGNELAFATVRVNLSGKGNGDLVVTFTEAVGHDSAKVFTKTISGFNFNGYMAFVCDNATIYDNDEIAFKNVSLVVNEYVMPSGVTINKTETTLKVGNSETLTATVTPSDVTDNSIIWSTSDSAIATVENGVVTGVAFGTATITAKSNKDNTKLATCTVKVNKAATGVTLNKNTLTLNRAATEILTATVAPIGECNAATTWISSDESIVTVENGAVTAIAKGTATITVTTVDGSFTATCAVTVVQSVNSVSLDKDTRTMIIGENVTLTATVLPAAADNKTVTWSSSDTAVAAVENGVVTAVKAGSAIITVTTQDGALTAECEITVNPMIINVSGVTLDKTAHTLVIGSNFTLTATVLPGNATNKTVVWSTGNSAVATVDQNGKVTAVSAGTVTITAEVDGKSATCVITVNAPDEKPEDKGCASMAKAGVGSSLVILLLLSGLIVIAKKKSEKKVK